MCITNDDFVVCRLMVYDFSRLTSVSITSKRGMTCVGLEDVLTLNVGWNLDLIQI